MSRTARLVLVGYMHHITHCGHDHTTLFKDEDDYLAYIAEIKTQRERHSIGIHGYCLFKNAVHMLAIPREGRNDLCAFMKAMAGNTTRHYNDKYGATGTPWYDRYHSSPVQPGIWELACLRYVDTLAMHRGLVTTPGCYPHSSYNMRIDNVEHSWLSGCLGFQSLAEASKEQRRIYRLYCGQSIPKWENDTISGAVQRNQLTGDNRFIEEVQQAYGVRVSNRKRGRPPKDRKR